MDLSKPIECIVAAFIALGILEVRLRKTIAHVVIRVGRNSHGNRVSNGAHRTEAGQVVVHVGCDDTAGISERFAAIGRVGAELEGALPTPNRMEAGSVVVLVGEERRSVQL